MKLIIFVTFALVTAATALTALDCDPIHEEFEDCVGKVTSRCEMTCDTFRSPSKVQICQCEAKCICKQRFVRNSESGQCVYRFQCPNSWWPWAPPH